MSFKFNANGSIAVDFNKRLPILVHLDWRKAQFDADGTVAIIGRLNGETKSHHEAKEAAELKLMSFEGIEYGPAALAALETVKNIKAGDLTTAANVQEIKDAAAKSAKEIVANATRTAQEKEKEKQISDKLAQRTTELNTHEIAP